MGPLRYGSGAPQCQGVQPHKAVEGAAPDLLRELLHAMVTKIMGAEVDALCGAGYDERSPERVIARNGYRARPWDTRVGTIDLALRSSARGRTSRAGCWSRAGGGAGAGSGSRGELRARGVDAQGSRTSCRRSGSRAGCPAHRRSTASGTSPSILVDIGYSP